MSDSFNHFAEIAEAMDTALQQIPRKGAFDIIADYAAHAARDTGFMANSGYVVTADSGTYGKGDAPTKEGAHLLPAVATPDDKYTAIAAIGASYAEMVELGTVHMAAQPAFYPAVDRARPGIEAAVAAVKDAMEKATS